METLKLTGVVAVIALSLCLLPCLFKLDSEIEQ